MSEPPDQKQLWDAYGHAMGAIGAVELLLRIALISASVTRMIAEGDLTDQRKKAELEKIQGRTLGPTVDAFKEAFPEFANDAAFCESIRNAVSSRNRLAHHFVEDHLLAFRTDRGIQLVVLECFEHTDHYRSLENYIRERCSVDYEAFFALGEDKADEYAQTHPLNDKLDAITAGTPDGT